MRRNTILLGLALALVTACGKDAVAPAPRSNVPAASDLVAVVGVVELVDADAPLYGIRQEDRLVVLRSDREAFLSAVIGQEVVALGHYDDDGAFRAASVERLASKPGDIM